MKNNKGFSLVELIVVIAIMAILAAVAVVSFNIYIQKAKETNDAEYRSNVEYFAKLEATEHQFKLDEVELEDVVDGPEDIILWIELPSGQLLDVSYADEDYAQIIQDIFNAVGPWTFSYACDHSQGTLTTAAADCLIGARDVWSCCGKEENVSDQKNPNNHRTNEKPTDSELEDADKTKDGKYYILECQWCHEPIHYDPTNHKFAGVGDMTGPEAIDP